MDADSARVRFSPDTARSFARLEAALSDSKHFDAGLLVNLQELAEGKTLSVHRALSEVANITRETMRHITATGDAKAKAALDEVITNLMGLGLDSKPVTILPPPRSRLR
jgi:hypothetical protein